ncbi:MAG: NDP-sugar synthase [Nitrososphaerota archaeon]
MVFAAGLGKRLRPLTNTRPKHLLPVIGKPLLLWILESLILNGFREIGILVSYMKEKVIEEISKIDLGGEITWIDQRGERGTGDALKACREYLKNEDYFLVVYGDVLVNPSIIKDLVEFFRENVCDGVVEGVYVQDTIRFGRIEYKDMLLKKIEEKSIGGPGIVNSGLYVLPGISLDIVEEVKPSQRGEYELTDLLNIMVKRGMKILVHVSEKDWWMDIGTPLDYLKVNIKKFIEEYGFSILSKSDLDCGCVLKAPVMISKNVRISGEVALGPNAFLMDDVIVEGNVVVENAVVLERCRIKGNSILKNVIVGEDSEISGSIHIDGGSSVHVVAPNSMIDTESLKKF